jgi:hypothetical protein
VILRVGTNAAENSRIKIVKHEFEMSIQHAHQLFPQGDMMADCRLSLKERQDERATTRSISIIMQDRASANSNLYRACKKGRKTDGMFRRSCMFMKLCICYHWSYHWLYLGAARAQTVGSLKIFQESPTEVQKHFVPANITIVYTGLQVPFTAVRAGRIMSYGA